MYGVKLEGGTPRIYSGICIKSGDITKHPLGAECIFLRVPEQEYQDLYDEFRKIKDLVWGERQVRADSIFMDYIIEPPDEDKDPGLEPVDNRVKFVKHFDALIDMVRTRRNGIILLRESLRTLPVNELKRRNRTHRLEVFRHSTFVKAINVTDSTTPPADKAPSAAPSQ